jgi:hypothetical protein
MEMTLVLIFALAVLIPTALVGWFSWWLWKKGPYGRVAAAVISVTLAYFIVTAIFPPPSFYREEFAYRTGIAVPPSAKIKFMKASYSDFHGDYACEMVFEVSSDDFAWLQRASKINSKTGNESLGGMYWREAEIAFGKKLEAKLSGGIRTRNPDERGAWALLSDGKTVYFWFVQT